MGGLGWTRLGTRRMGKLCLGGDGGSRDACAVEGPCATLLLNATLASPAAHSSPLSNTSIRPPTSPSPLSKQVSPSLLHSSTLLLQSRPITSRPADRSLGGAPVALLQTTSPRASQHSMSDLTNYLDPLDNWDIINDADWLEAAIALDLDDPAIAAAEPQLPV